MEKKKFLQCRAEVLRVLENYDAQDYELGEVCVSALNERIMGSHFVASIQFHDKISFTGKTWTVE